MNGQTKRIKIAYSPQEYQREIHKSSDRFRVVIIGRRGGKTELAINEIIKRAVQKPGLYWIVAPSYRQVKSIIWTRLKALLKVDEHWKFNEQELYAEHPIINTRIELRGADNEDSLRGVGLNGVVFDEAAMIKANVWPEIVRPMLADTGGWALFISTPKGRNWLYDLYINESDSWASWSYPTNINRFIDEEEIVQAKKDMSERLFKQEFLAQFLDDETGVFKRVRQCIVGNLQEPQEGRFYVMGVDLAKTEDFTVLTVIDSLTREVVAFERFQDISWKEQKIRIQELATRYNNALCIVDSTGVGDPIYEDLQNSGLSVDGFKFTNDSKNKLIEQCAIAIEQRQVTFPRDCEELIEELMSYEYSITDKGRITYSAPSGKHDDCVISLALGVWAIRTQLHESQILKDEEEPEIQNRQGMGRLVTNEEEEYNFSGY